jgi:hypothetical protein
MPDKSKRGKRYPLEHKPLRNPGESLGTDMERVFEEEFLFVMIYAIGMVIFAVDEWIRFFHPLPPHPIPTTIIALLAVGFAVYRFFITREKYRNLRLGYEGEKFVGQYLEDLRSQGCRVFHDVVGKDANIDHVVVGPQGIFVIETKTYNKPSRGKAQVEFDGEKILINGKQPDRDAAIQVKAGIRWLSNLLHETTGHRFPIKGAVVFPGWYVIDHTANTSDVWVMNHVALKSFIEHEPIRLKSEDIALISSRLLNYVENA